MRPQSIRRGACRARQLVHAIVPADAVVVDDGISPPHWHAACAGADHAVSAPMTMLVLFGRLLWRCWLALFFRLGAWRCGRHRDALAVLQQSLDRAAFRHAFAA